MRRWASSRARLTGSRRWPCAQRVRTWAGTLGPLYRGGGNLASRLLNGRPPVIFEEGAQSRDFTRVSDIMGGILLALGSHAAPCHAISPGTGSPTTVAEVAGALSSGMGVHIEQSAERPLPCGRHPTLPSPTPTRADELLGFEATVGFEAGMAELLAWLRDQEAVDRVDDARRDLAARGLTR
jgi:dTDP-L-rhamnose 4-epimerase